MMKMLPGSWSARIAFALVAVFAGGCATTGGDAGPGAARGAADEGGTLAERSVARWKLLIARDAGAAWTYLTPGYRESVAQDRYAQLMNNRPVRWVGVEYKSEECDGEDACDVLVEVAYQVPINVGGAVPGQAEATQVLRERWIRLDGVWYHLPRDLM